MKLTKARIDRAFLKDNQTRKKFKNKKFKILIKNQSLSKLVPKNQKENMLRFQALGQLMKVMNKIS